MTPKRYLTVEDFPLGRDACGWPLCRVCGNRVPTKRNTTCSVSCRETLQFMCLVSSQAWRVEKRDRGICALCGCDTAKVARIFIWLRDAHGWQRLGDIQKHMGFNGGATTATWEMDHIVPVCKGGGVTSSMTILEGMANLRTLCVPCHKAETRALASRRAAATDSAGAV